MVVWIRDQLTIRLISTFRILDWSPSRILLFWDHSKYLMTSHTWWRHYWINYSSYLSSMASFSDLNSARFFSDSIFKVSNLFWPDFFSRSKISIFETSFLFSSSSPVIRSSSLSFCRWILSAWKTKSLSWFCLVPIPKETKQLLNGCWLVPPS